MLRRLVTVSLLLGAAAMAGCGLELSTLFPFLTGSTTGTTTSDAQISELRRFGSETELQNYLIEQSGATRGGSDQDYATAGDETANLADASGSNAPTAAPQAESGGTAADGVGSTFSTTTEQEAGVQESDVIKNDGQYIYILSRGVLRIVDATPASAITEVSSIGLGGWGYDLFLTENRVIAITTPDEPTTVATATATDASEELLISPIYYYYNPQVDVTVIDVTDRANPRVASRSRFDGSISASRMIGNQLYLVMVDYPQDIIRSFDPQTGEPIFADLTVDELLPDVTIEVDGEVAYSGNITTYDEFYAPTDPDGLGITMVVGMDVDDPTAYHARSLVGYPSNIYSSTDALYLTNTEWDFEGNLRTTTTLYKFAYTDDGPTLVAGGTITGRVLNQYSMGEYNGYLRVATTIDPQWTEWGMTEQSSSNEVHVLQQNGDRLEQVGSITGIAPGESIYAARFIGDKGYVVTFRQVDPLHTLDLSDPLNPRVVGELHVPGYSTFILPIDDNHLLTIGQTTQDTEGGWTVIDDMQLAIYDITDFANPQQEFTTIISTNGGWSEALYNPKALTYYAEGGMLALPVDIVEYDYSGMVDFDVITVTNESGEVTEGSGTDSSAPTDTGTNGGEGQTEPAMTGTDGVEEIPPPEVDTNGVPDDNPPPDVTTDGEVPPEIIEVPPYIAPQIIEEFHGLYVYRVSATTGFQLLGRISTTAPTDPQNPWNNSWPLFTRGVFIDANVYAVTSDSVQAAATSAVETILSAVEFPIPQSDFGPMPVDDLVAIDGATGSAEGGSTGSSGEGVPLPD